MKGCAVLNMGNPQKKGKLIPYNFEKSLYNTLCSARELCFSLCPLRIPELAAGLTTALPGALSLRSAQAAGRQSKRIPLL